MVRDANKLLLRMQARIVKHAWKEMAYSNFRTEKGKRKSRERNKKRLCTDHEQHQCTSFYKEKDEQCEHNIIHRHTHIYIYIYI